MCKRKPPGTHHPAPAITNAPPVLFSFTHPLTLAQYHFKANLKPRIISFIKVSDYISKRYKFVQCRLITKSCPTLCDHLICSPPGFSVHGISQARILEWVVISSSRGSSQLRDRTCISCTAGRFFTTEPPGKPGFVSIKV